MKIKVIRKNLLVVIFLTENSFIPLYEVVS